MVRKSIISGIKRKSTAIEGTYRYFQTIDRILIHFKRTKDKKKIKELLTPSSTFKDLLIATAAIHLYHDMGIRNMEVEQIEHTSFESALSLEKKQKEVLMSEFRKLLKEDLHLKINLSYKIIDIENLFLKFLIRERDEKLKDFEKDKILEDINTEIENEIIYMVSKYPSFYFYDFIGDLIGLTSEVKQEILEKSASFRDLTLNLEKKLEEEEKEDKFIELSTLNLLMEKIKQMFEFKSYRELQTQAMPVRMIKNKIINYELEKYPVSLFGLRMVLESNIFRKKIINLIESSLNEKIDYEYFESQILSMIKTKLIEQLNSNPNDFIYLLQGLMKKSFNEIIFLMKKWGIYDILKLFRINNPHVEEFKKNMIRYNLTENDFLKITDLKRNLSYKITRIFSNPLLLQKLMNLIKDGNNGALSSLIFKDEPDVKDFFKEVEKTYNINLKDLRDFFRKKSIINKIFFNNLTLENHAQLILLLRFDEIIENMVKDIYLSILSKILRQYCRIIELYNKISNDKGLYLLALKNIENLSEEEDWIAIKFEELILKRLKSRQIEIVRTLNANNQPFLVNGLILSILKEISLGEAIKELEEAPSYLYLGIKDLKLKKDIISPISYCIAFDILKRFEEFTKKHKLKVLKKKEEEKRKEDLRKKEFREIKERSTFNWIERRITSSLIGINRPGINPNQFYWKEKDTKIVAENIKIHSELKGTVFERFCEFYILAIKKIKEYAPEMKLPSEDRLKADVFTIINSILSERLKKETTEEDIEKILNGERFQVANQLAIKIGRFLDKALYYKFKKKQR